MNNDDNKNDHYLFVKFFEGKRFTIMILRFRDNRAWL